MNPKVLWLIFQAQIKAQLRPRGSPHMSLQKPITITKETTTTQYLQD